MFKPLVWGGAVAPTALADVRMWHVSLSQLVHGIKT
jgi:hypothetical protein